MNLNAPRYTEQQAWDALKSRGISEETLTIVTSINGYNLDTLEDILFAAFGYHDFDDLKYIPVVDPLKR